ncbi:hypothetical protein SKAU_G00366140 [Synaphobranchus kaupii]|uniref:Uncharacterized protein n=1 Tax=Synaphobranchus kaupii TaxID=118154 RepID=A0A9Q1IDC8_SYNKA|nr:hypothetical protein SKAU_G00366140 [Synaphobranchus kaupii]
MQNTSGPRAQRYRPASEFDEATLARKREYWRTKKREQRAKLSVLKKERLKAANTRVCKARASAGHLTGDTNEHKALALEVPGPTLLKGDGNYQAGLCHGPSHEFEKISHHVETGENVSPPSDLSSELFSTAPRQVSKATIWQQKLQDGIERWGAVRSRTHRQKLLESQRMISQRGVRRAFSPAMALSIKKAQKSSVEETNEDKMARKREYWRTKKREQRAKLSVEVKAKMKERDSLLRRVKRYQCILTEMRRARTGCNKSRQPPGSGNPLAGDNETIGGFIKEDGTMTTNIPQASANYRLSEQETLPASRTFPKNQIPVANYEQQVEQDPTTIMDSQATTLLAVASMKKLLEESLSSVVDSNDLSPCKREQVSSEEEVAQVEVKPSLPCLSQAREEYAFTPERHHTALGTTTQSTELHPCQAQSPSCLKPAQVLSTSQAASSQSPASSQTGSPSSNLKHSHTPLSRQSLTHAPSCSHATSSNQPLQLRRAQRLRAKRVGHHCCSPEPPKKAGNSPSQPQEDDLRKKREYWRIAKREQRAKKAAQEREMKKSREQSKQIPRPSQGAPVCTVKTHKPGLRNEGHNRPPTLQTNSPPLVLSSTSGTLTCLKSVTTLPILKVFTPVQSTPRLCSTVFENKAPSARDPSKSSSLPAADSHTSLNCSTLPCPTGGNSRDAVQSGTVGSTGRLLLLESQQNRPPGSSPESLQVKRWQLQVRESPDTPSSQSAFPKKLPSLALQVGGTASQGGGQTLAGRPTSHTPPSCNVQLRVGQEDARKPPDPPKPTKTPEQLDEDLRKKREYWRVKKKEQRARKAARERETKRQGTPGGWRTILPAKEVSKSLETQEQVSNPWPNSALKDSQLLPSTSSKYNDQPQRCLTGAGKDELDMDMEAGEEDEEEEEGEEEEEEGHEDAPSSEACWRTQFLMDFDPLNQLLVCMAWDEQVFLRERFFSNQLQQQSGVLSGESQERPAEVEVMVDLEESPALKNLSKASKTKSLKKV